MFGGYIVGWESRLPVLKCRPRWCDPQYIVSWVSLSSIPDKWGLIELTLSSSYRD